MMDSVITVNLMKAVQVHRDNFIAMRKIIAKHEKIMTTLISASKRDFTFLLTMNFVSALDLFIAQNGKRNNSLQPDPLSLII